MDEASESCRQVDFPDADDLQQSSRHASEPIFQRTSHRLRSIKTVVAFLLLGAISACQFLSHRPYNLPPLPRGSPSNLLAERHHGEDIRQRLLSEHRVIQGTVIGIAGDQLKVDVGEVQPRFLPLQTAREKRLRPLNQGDHIEIALNTQNLAVDYHPLDDTPGRHRVLEGRIAQPLPIGHDGAIVRTSDGMEAAFKVRAHARSTMAAIPVGADAVFLIDETDEITDATCADRVPGADQRHATSPPKAAHRRIEGSITEPLTLDLITVRTHEGSPRPFEVRPLVYDRLAQLAKGDSVILLVDTDEKVIDVAVPPKTEG